METLSLTDSINKAVEVPTPPIGSLKLGEAIDYASGSNPNKSILPTDNHVSNFNPIIEKTNGNSKYDAGYIAGNSPLEDYRYENQSGAVQLGLGALRTIGGAILNLGEAASVLTSGAGGLAANAMSAINNEFSSDKDKTGYYGIDDMVNNPLDNFFYGIEDKMKEQFAVYKPSNWDSKSIGQQMASTAWWADDGASVAAFALSNLIPAGEIANLGLGAKVAGAAAKGAEAIVDAGEAVGKMGTLGKYANEILMSKAGLINPVGIAKGTESLAQNAYMTTSEAFFMARDAGKAVEENYLHSKGKENLSDLTPQEQQELTKAKSTSENYTFWSNMVALTGVSHVEAGFVNRVFGHASTEEIGHLINLGENIGDDATKVASTGVQKFLNNKYGSIAKNVPKYIITEGVIKANVQNAIQAVTTQFGFLGKGDYLSQVASTAISQLGSADAWKGMMANVVVGGIMGVVGGVREQGDQNRAVDSTIKGINQAKENFVNLQNVMYQKDDAGNIVIDPTTKKPVYNVPAIQDYVANLQQTQDLSAIHDTFKNAGEQQVANIIKNELFTKYAISHLEAGLGDQFIAKVKALNSYKDEDLAKLGFDPIEIGPNGNKITIAERTQELLQQATQIQKDYNQASKTIGYVKYYNTGDKKGDSLQNSNLQNSRINEAVKLQSRIRALDELAKTSNQNLLELQAKQVSSTGDSNIVDSINSQARVLEAKVNSFHAGLENGNISPDSRMARQLAAEIDELHKSIIEQKESSKPIIEKLGYQVNSDSKELIDEQPQTADITAIKNHLQDIEDAKVAKLGLQDKYNKISDYNNGAEYFVNEAKNKAVNDINEENVRQDEEDTTNKQLGNFNEGDEVSYDGKRGQITKDSQGNLTINGEKLSQGFLNRNPDLRKLSQQEVDSEKANGQKQAQVNSLSSKIQNIHDRLTHLTTEDNREKSTILNSIIKPEEIILNEVKGRVRLSSDDLSKQLDHIQDAKVIVGRENTEITNELQSLQTNPDALEADVNELQQESAKNEDEYKRLDDLQSRIEDLSKSLFPEESKSKKEFNLDKPQLENIKQISADLLGLKNDFQSKVDSLNNQSKNYQLELNKLLKSINDKPEDETGDNPPTTSSSPIPAIENKGLFKTAGANSKDGKLTDSYSQKVWGDWANKFDPKNKEGYSLRTVTLNDSEYGLGGSKDDLYKEEDKKYQHKDNIKVLVVDKQGNPVYHQGSKVYTSLPEIIDSKTEPEHFINFRSDNKLLAKQSIEEYRDFANLIKNSKEPVKLQIIGKSNGRIVIGEPIDATKAFGKQLPLRVITDDKTTIEGNDYPLPKGLVYVNYNGRPIGAEARTLTPEESKAVLDKLKEYAKLRGNSEAVNNKELITQLKGTILLNERNSNPDLSIYFVKGSNNLTFGDKVVSTKDLIEGKYDEQLREFLDNQNLQVDRSLLSKNATFKDIFDKQWSSYQDYLLSARENIQDTPLTFKIQPLLEDINKPQFLNTYLTYSKLKLSTEEVKPQEKTSKTQATVFEFGTSLPFVSLSSLIENKESILKQIEPTQEVSNLIKENEGNSTTSTTTTKDEQGTISGTTKETATDGGRSKEENTTKLQTDLLDDLYDYEPTVTFLDSKTIQEQKIYDSIQQIITPEDLSELKEDLKTEDENEVKEIIKEEVQNLISGTKSTRSLTDRIKRILSKIAKHFMAFGIFVNLNLPTKLYEAPIKDSTVIKTELKTRTFDKFNDLSPAGKQVYQSEIRNNKAFIIVDKPTATTYIIGANGERIGSFPAILGTARGEEPNTAVAGDKTTLNRATTPAGRFTLYNDHDKAYDDRVLALDNQGGIAIHEVYPGQLEARTKALDTPSIEDNRMSWGCINVDSKNWDKYIKGNIDTKSVIIITPDRQSFYLKADVIKNYQPIDFEKEKQWFKDNISSSIPFEKVKGLIDKQAYGKFLQAGKVLISDEATEGTGYHEAFHVVSQLYLSDKERSELYSKYRKGTNITDKQVEEGLAEEFREYQLTKQSSYKEFFDKIINFIKQLVGIGNSDKDVLFSRISSGYFADSGIKSKSDLDLYKMSDHLDASTTKDVMDSMTLTLVRGVFKNNFSLNDIERFNEGLLSEEDSGRFKNLYSSVLATMNQAMLKAAEKQSNGEHIKNVVKYINENKASVQLDHLAYLKKFGINLEVEPDIELPEDYQRAKDTLGIISAIEFSAKNGMPNVIKLMIGSLPKLTINEEGKRIPSLNNLGLPKLSDYRKNTAILQNELSGISSFKEQMAKIKLLSTRIPELSLIADQLGVSEGQITPANLRAGYFDLQAKFRQQFDKAYYNFYTQIYDGNNSHLLDSNTDKLTSTIKARWQGNAFANKEAYVVKNGQYILNPEYFKKNYDKALKGEAKAKSILSFYKDLGITFSQPGLVDLDVLADKQKALISKMLENDISSIFQDEAESKGFVNSIVEQELATSLDYSDNQHINPEGKTIYNVSLHNYLTRLTAEINNFGLPKELSWDEETQQGNPLLRHSAWKDKLEAGKTLKVGIQEGARVNEPGEDGVSTSNLSTPDAASQQFTAVLSGHSPYMRAGDKALEHSFSFGDVPKYASLDDITNYFKGHLADELLSSYMLNIQGVGEEYLEYVNSAKDLRVFKDIFNKTDEARYKSIINDKTIDRAEAVRQIDIFVEEDSSKEALQKWFDKYAEENKQVLLDNNLVIKANDVYSLVGIPTELADKFVGKSDILLEGQMKSLVEQFTYNQLQGNIEQTKIFTGDVAFYKDFFKRTSGLTGTGKSTWVGGEIDAWLNENRPREYQSYDGKIKVDKQSDSKIQSLMFNDIKTVSSNFKEYVENLVGKGLSREYANSILDKYGKAYDEGDAQGYITLPEYREFLTRTGDWTASHEALYPKLIKGEEISAKDLGNFLSGYAVLKPQYFGKQTDANGLFVPTFYKFSAMPLIPSVVRGTELEELMHTMLQTGHGLSVFKTANKVGAKTGNNLYDESGKINLNNLITQELDYASMKVQLDINPKTKDKVIFGTQFRKLVLANLAGKSLTINGNQIDGNRIIKTYSDLIDKTIQIETKNLIDKLGLTDAGNGQFRLSKPEFLRNLLSNEALQRQAPDNLLEGIKQILPEEGGHKQFDLLVSRNKIENILMSLVNNNIIKQKTFGDLRVQGASTGFEAKSGLKGRGIHDAEKATWWSKVEQESGENSSLSFYKANENGTKSMEIYLPHYFKELIGKDVDINRIDDKLLNVIGYRTPTQGLNSMELMKIKGFLPQEAGNLIVVPSEIVVKSGSDFDIDKLSLHFPNYEMVDGEPKYLDYDSKNEAHQSDLARIYNRINDLAWKTIAAPENFQSLITPNSNGQVEEIAKEVAKIKESKQSPTDNGKGNNIGWKKNLDIRQAYLSGKEGIGIAAIHNTNHVLNQIVGLKAKPEVKINLEHNETEGRIDFSKEKEVEADPINSPTILDNLSAFLNGLVDMANNPFLSTINTTMDTLPTYLYLIKAGVPLRQAIMFMNQPIISDYLKMSQSNDSLGLKATDNKLSEERLLQKVLDLYPSKQAKLDLTNQSTLDNYKKTITSNKLEEYIQGNPNNAVQQQILLDYLTYKDQADGLSDLIKATTADTKGVGATMNSAQNVIDNYNKLKENSIFENVEKYMDETFIGSFQKAVEKSVQLYKPVFYTEKAEVKNELARIKEVVGLSKFADSEKAMNLAKNDIINYVLQTAPTDGTSIKNLAKDLYQTMAKDVAKAKEHPAFRDNPLIRELFPTISSNSTKEIGTPADLDKLKIFSKKLEAVDSNLLTEGWKDLFNLHEQFATNLMTFTILQSGLNNSPVSFTQYAPNEYYVRLVDRLLSNREASFDGFYDKFMRNNYQNNDLVPKISKSIMTSQGLYTIADGKEARITPPRRSKITGRLLGKDNTKYDYVKAWNKSLNGYELYKNTNTTTGTNNAQVFERVSKLGDGYNLKEWTDESIILSNRLDNSSRPSRNLDDGNELQDLRENFKDANNKPIC